MNRIKRLKVSGDILLQVARSGVAACVVTKNPLPDDADIIGASVEGPPGCRTVVFGIASATYPAVPMGMIPPEADVVTLENRCPHYAFASPARDSPLTVTLSRDDIAAMLYDADRAPGRRLTLTVRADGTHETAGG